MDSFPIQIQKMFCRFLKHLGLQHFILDFKRILFIVAIHRPVPNTHFAFINNKTENQIQNECSPKCQQFDIQKCFAVSTPYVSLHTVRKSYRKWIKNRHLFNDTFSWRSIVRQKVSVRCKWHRTGGCKQTWSWMLFQMNRLPFYGWSSGESRLSRYLNVRCCLHLVLFSGGKPLQLFAAQCRFLTLGFLSQKLIERVSGKKPIRNAK